MSVYRHEDPVHDAAAYFDSQDRDEERHTFAICAQCDLPIQADDEGNCGERVFQDARTGRYIHEECGCAYAIAILRKEGNLYLFE
jgi:hypothetical protein